jgi:hypothetical protein
MLSVYQEFTAIDFIVYQCVSIYCFLFLIFEKRLNVLRAILAVLLLLFGWSICFTIGFEDRFDTVVLFYVLWVDTIISICHRL